VLALAASGAYLFALRNDVDAPLQRLLPENQPVSFMSVWGEEIPKPLMNLPGSFGNINFATPIGFVPDPKEERRFYIANAFYNTVVSFRDLYGNPGPLGDPSRIEPPVKKPPRTFRILIVGDSRSGLTLGYSFPTALDPAKKDGDARSLRFPFAFNDYFNFAKRMELELNALAALENVPMNFDVMNYSLGANEPLFLWPTYWAPDIAQRWDADLVIIMQPPSGIFPFELYFTNPITPDGIPLHPNDVEYMLKPPLERIPDGETRRFYEICKTRHLVEIKGRNFVFDQSVFSVPELHDFLVDMYGKPLDVLNRKLSGMKTSSGKPVRLLLCNVHTGYRKMNLEDPKIWADAARRFHVSYLNLHDVMRALGLSYYPMGEEEGSNHLNIGGHLFLSLLMTHSLIQQGIIPWGGISSQQTPSRNNP
jgi:hypothetical protein